MSIDKDGVFYAVGVGPGDPELITYKAVRTIKECDIIVVPSSGASENIAFKIVKEHIKGKEIIEHDMPMIRDKQKLDESHENSANDIARYLDDGKKVAFLTIGDPTIYSTVMYVHKRLTAKGYDTRIISGVPSFCAVAASLNVSLCERSEMLHIIPASYKDTDSALNLVGNKVLMKSGKSIVELKDKLKGKNAMMVECATMENEKVYKTLDEVAGSSYFSVVVVKEDNEITEI